MCEIFFTPFFDFFLFWKTINEPPLHFSRNIRRRSSPFFFVAHFPTIPPLANPKGKYMAKWAKMEGVWPFLWVWPLKFQQFSILRAFPIFNTKIPPFGPIFQVYFFLDFLAKFCFCNFIFPRNLVHFLYFEPFPAIFGAIILNFFLAYFFLFWLLNF